MNQSSYLIPLAGFSIYESAAMCVQFRFPRSKRRRIRDKWAKDKRNFKPSLNVLRSGNTLICHPVMAARLREHLAETTAHREPRTAN